jgi:hypothetical protein
MVRCHELEDRSWVRICRLRQCSYAESICGVWSSKSRSSRGSRVRAERGPAELTLLGWGVQVLQTCSQSMSSRSVVPFPSGSDGKLGQILRIQQVPAIALTRCICRKDMASTDPVSVELTSDELVQPRAPEPDKVRWTDHCVTGPPFSTGRRNSISHCFGSTGIKPPRGGAVDAGFGSADDAKDAAV